MTLPPDLIERAPTELKWDRNRVCVAAATASNQFKQWVPQHWLELFMDAYESASPSPTDGGHNP